MVYDFGERLQCWCTVIHEWSVHNHNNGSLFPQKFRVEWYMILVKDQRLQTFLVDSIDHIKE